MLLFVYPSAAGCNIMQHAGLSIPTLFITMYLGTRNVRVVCKGAYTDVKVDSKHV